MPSWHATSHSVKLSLLQDGKWVSVKRQWQCSAAGKVWRHTSHASDSVVFQLGAQWPQRGRQAPAYTPGKSMAPFTLFSSYKHSWTFPSQSPKITINGKLTTISEIDSNRFTCWKMSVGTEVSRVGGLSFSTTQHCARVSWSLTSLISTSMATSETIGHGWTAILHSKGVS